MGLGIILGSAAKSGLETYERLAAEERRKKEFDEQERLRNQRKALEEQSAALPAIGTAVDTNSLPATQRTALGVPLTQDQNQMVQPSATPPPQQLWQANAANASTPVMQGGAPGAPQGLPAVVADNKASTAMPNRTPSMRNISQSDQMMMLADVYRRNGQPDKAIELANKGMELQTNELGAAAAMAGVQGWDSLKKFSSMMKDGKDFSYSQIKGGQNDGKYMVQYGDGAPQMVNDSIHAGLLLSAAIKKDPQMIASLVHQYGTRDLENAKLEAQKNHWAAEEEVAKSHVNIQQQVANTQAALAKAQAAGIKSEVDLRSQQLSDLQRKADAIKGYADLAKSDPLLYGNDMLSAAQLAETADPERLVKSNTVVDQSTGQPVSVTVGVLQEAIRKRLTTAQGQFQKDPYVAAGKIVVNPNTHQYGVVDKAGNKLPVESFTEAQKMAGKIWGATPPATAGGKAPAKTPEPEAPQYGAVPSVY